MDRVIELARKIILAVSEGKAVTAANKRIIKESADAIVEACRNPPPDNTKPISIDDINTLKKEIIAEVNQTIKKTLSATHQPTTTRLPLTYASATKNQIQPTPAPKKPALIINTVPSSTSDSSDQTPTTNTNAITQLKSQLSFKKQTFAPARVQPIAGGRIYLEFDTALQQKEALQLINNTNTLKAEEAKRRRPLAILKGIHIDTTREELIDTICNQNAIKKEDIRLCFLTKNRNQKLYNAVIEIQPAAYQHLSALGRVAVNFQQVHFEPHSRLTQCRKCLQFGHSAAKCSSTLLPCAICAATDHQGDTCPQQSSSTKQFTCYNCAKHNSRTGAKLPTNHAANNTAICPRIAAAREAIEKTIDYGFTAPPNTNPLATTT